MPALGDSPEHWGDYFPVGGGSIPLWKAPVGLGGPSTKGMGLFSPSTMCPMGGGVWLSTRPRVGLGSQAHPRVTNTTPSCPISGTLEGQGLCPARVCLGGEGEQLKGWLGPGPESGQVEGSGLPSGETHRHPSTPPVAFCPGAAGPCPPPTLTLMLALGVPAVSGWPSCGWKSL